MLIIILDSTTHAMTATTLAIIALDKIGTNAHLAKLLTSEFII